MVFSSHLFIFYFLPPALGLYYLAPRRLRHGLLTLLSYLFYGWANPAFVILLLISTLIDYGCGLAIAGRAETLPPASPHARRTTVQRAALTLSIVTNLGLLGFFKYFNFAVDSYDALLQSLGLSAWRLDLALRVTLPLGISFYTFQSMSYTIDVYRGHAPVLRNPIDFACYVSMFPQLVAGPIIRFSEVADQLRSRTHSLTKAARGAAFFAVGLAKKILIANVCAQVADAAFDAGALHGADAWLGVGAYAFQIYFDFSGYSDMAIGLGLLFGFVFPKNFDSPYRAASITEFWQRWHISLSSWLRDYLYIPLGGNRRGPWRTTVNLAVVMLLGGLWHGAAWNFLVWGALHGALLAVERAHRKTPLYQSLPRPLRVALTFLLVCVSWVFFRARDLPAALAYLAAMAGCGAPPPSAALLAVRLYQPYYLLTLAAAVAITWGAPQTWDWTRNLTAGKSLVAILLLIAAVLILETQAYNPFIYFIF